MLSTNAASAIFQSQSPSSDRFDQHKQRDHLDDRPVRAVGVKRARIARLCEASICAPVVRQSALDSSGL
jgi:hypothetical protein